MRKKAEAAANSVRVCISVLYGYAYAKICIRIVSQFIHYCTRSPEYRPNVLHDGSIIHRILNT